jgi:hypothetical protein
MKKSHALDDWLMCSRDYTQMAGDFPDVEGFVDFC